MFCATAACFTFQTICDSVLFGCIRQRFIKINPLDDCPKLTHRCAVAVGTLDNLPPIHRRDFHLSSAKPHRFFSAISVLPRTKHTAGEPSLQRSPDIGCPTGTGHKSLLACCLLKTE